MAFLAFGVFATLAITTAILRDCYVPARWKNSMSKFTNRWLYVDVVLNTLTYFWAVAVMLPTEISMASTALYVSF